MVCFVFCVLCVVCCVLCFVFCVLCLVFGVWCCVFLLASLLLQVSVHALIPTKPMEGSVLHAAARAVRHTGLAETAEDGRTPGAGDVVYPCCVGCVAWIVMVLDVMVLDVWRGL